MKYLHLFQSGTAEVDGNSSAQLGNKGAKLAAMSRMGLPVPPGFTISTEVSRYFQKTGELPPLLVSEVNSALQLLGGYLGFEFGSSDRPLLVSVRSAPLIPMPGIMSTLPNIGLTSATLRGLIASTENPRFAYDTFRRLIEAFAKLFTQQSIEGASMDGSARVLAEHLKRMEERWSSEEPSESELARICDEYLELSKEFPRPFFPEDPKEQLWKAIEAVLRSWHSPHAVAFRERREISHEIGAAVIVQAMVFGNRGPSSGAGVLFTRDPLTGGPKVSGEWLPNCQGEDIMDGNLMPVGLTRDARRYVLRSSPSLEEALPGVYNSLVELAKVLESHYRDAQEIEFTVQEGRLWLLQSRRLNLNRAAIVRTAVDLVRNGLITVQEALSRTDQISLDQVIPWQIPSSITAEALIVANGLPASGGVAVGALALTPDRAEQFSREGKPVVLVSDRLKPEDIGGIDAAVGLVTNRGGMASHVAATARSLNKACVVGCGALKIIPERGVLLSDGNELNEKDEVTVDGNKGFVYRGHLPIQRADGEFGDYISALRHWREESIKQPNNVSRIE